jgi:hypothetical protein
MGFVTLEPLGMGFVTLEPLGEGLSPMASRPLSLSCSLGEFRAGEGSYAYT